MKGKELFAKDSFIISKSFQRGFEYFSVFTLTCFDVETASLKDGRANSHGSKCNSGVRDSEGSAAGDQLTCSRQSFRGGCKGMRRRRLAEHL